MYGLAVYVKEGLPFARDLSLENSADSYVFDWLYFTQCLTSFSSIDHLLCLCAVFLILFHLTQMRFSRSTHLLVFLSLLRFITQLMTILVLIGKIFVIILELFHGRISLNSVVLQLLVNFVSGFKLELMYISLSKVSGQAALISMVFSCLCCCHISQKSLVSFVPKG